VHLSGGLLVKTKSALKMKEGGWSRGWGVGGGNVPVRGVGRPMLFLRFKRIPGDGVIN
jgi:hypothetical protein